MSTGTCRTRTFLSWTTSGGAWSPLEARGEANTILGFLGVNDVEVVNVNGRSPESVEASFERAQARFNSLVEGFAAAA